MHLKYKSKRYRYIETVLSKELVGSFIKLNLRVFMFGYRTRNTGGEAYILWVMSSKLWPHR